MQILTGVCEPPVWEGAVVGGWRYRVPIPPWKVLDFFLENSRTWKVLEKHFGPGNSWKNILENYAFLLVLMKNKQKTSLYLTLLIYENNYSQHFTSCYSFCSGLYSEYCE